MSVRKEMAHTEGIYFITFTCYKWIPLFEMTDAYDEVYKQFDLLKSDGHYIIGYVIMPNHVHAVIAFKETHKSINRRIGTLKRFVSYALVERLKKSGATEILQTLAAGVNKTDQQKGKLHAVFEPSFDCKECFSETIIIQKLNYMHNNPCMGKWKLAANPIDYKHSSAGFYIANEPGNYPVTNYMILTDIDLTKP